MEEVRFLGKSQILWRKSDFMAEARFLEKVRFKDFMCESQIYKKKSHILVIQVDYEQVHLGCKS
jgi:hypothetical protein